MPDSELQSLNVGAVSVCLADKVEIGDDRIAVHDLVDTNQAVSIAHLIFFHHSGRPQRHKGQQQCQPQVH